uniref:Uncharacterized protein n=1 Tax=Mycoplasma anserisalpingitidis TaxID=519450 RepID=A0A8F2IVE1_9MOLU|nr:hypothetical protein [Mycoplasma anserisalpingitidis]
MNLTPIRNFLENTDELLVFYIYKAKDSFKIWDEVNKEQKIQVTRVGHIEALVSDEVFTLKNDVIEPPRTTKIKQEDIVKYSLTRSFTAIVGSEFNFLEDEFYLLKRGEKWYFVEEITKTYDFNGNDDSFIWKLEIASISKIKKSLIFTEDEVGELKYQKVIDDVKSEYPAPSIKADGVEINFPTSTLFSQITVIADLEDKSSNAVYENQIIPLKNNSSSTINSYPLILNPFLVSNSSHDRISLYSFFNFFMSSMKCKNWLLDLYPSWTVDLTKILSEQKSIEVIEEVLKISDTFTSFFAGYSDEQKEEFFKKYNNLSDATKINDNIIHKEIKRLEFISVDEANTFKNVILALSSDILSSYCYQGGYIFDYRLMLPFYLVRNGKTFEIRSEWLSFGKQGKIEFLDKTNKMVFKNNTMTFNNSSVNFDILPSIISEVNVSTSPAKFNTQESNNFRYLLHIFSSSSDFATKFLLNKSVQSQSLEPFIEKYEYVVEYDKYFESNKNTNELTESDISEATKWVNEYVPYNWKNGINIKNSIYYQAKSAFDNNNKFDISDQYEIELIPTRTSQRYARIENGRYIDYSEDDIENLANGMAYPILNPEYWGYKYYYKVSFKVKVDVRHYRYAYNSTQFNTNNLTADHYIFTPMSLQSTLRNTQLFKSEEKLQIGFDLEGLNVSVKKIKKIIISAIGINSIKCKFVNEKSGNNANYFIKKQQDNNLTTILELDLDEYYWNQKEKERVELEKSLELKGVKYE